MDEEERRRRCIINPELCGGPPPGFAGQAFTGQEGALAEEVYLAHKSPHDQPWWHLAPHAQEPWLVAAKNLLAVFEFRLRGEGDEDHGKGKSGKGKSKADD